VTVALVDRQGELSFLLGDSHGAGGNPPELIFLADDRPLRAAIPQLARPYLGAFSRTLHSPLFPASLDSPGSIALLPLRRGQELWGSLNFASGDLNRFDRASRTDFLERLAAVVSICLENGVNYERLRQIGMKDALTGVNNRRYLHERLEEELAASSRQDKPLTCMFLDIDHFKGFNDRFGHEAGDTVLSEVARLIRAQIRRSDSLCRYGGEEFVLLMPDTAEHAGRETAERIRRTVADHHFIVPGGSRVQVTLSIGVTVYPCEGVHPDDPKALLRSADRALYRAKEAGRNRVMPAD
jgi:two-component system cell cycle response regulator